MLIGGLQKISLIDYPDKVSAVVFTQGCNFRCPYCHNWGLVLPSDRPVFLDEGEVFNFLDKRKGLVDAVCITGGEPTLQQDLGVFVEKVKKLGFLVKLDTNGSRPGVVRELLDQNLLDYLALDVKAPLDNGSYRKVVNADMDVAEIVKTLRLLAGADISWEVRTTIVPTLLGLDSLVDMANQIRPFMNKHFVGWSLQQFRPKSCLNRKFEKIRPYSEENLRQILSEGKKIVPLIKLRI
ncbi:MAG: anaerobic ribonucleoside-triphosphate reductase activating protein [Chloroflexota bacterium]|nr:MAG: anaerobic ribonucleoside-triphosphate reductase activating protein [Chloroflexota bacterium]